MASVAEKYADKIVVTSDNSRAEPTKSIIADIIKGFSRSDYTVTEDREAAIKETILAAENGDIVAIIGKGDERYTIDADGYHYFDERKIIRDALSMRRGENEN